jgi:N-acetylglucosamine kinase-like BadF-type ATPase
MMVTMGIDGGGSGVRVVVADEHLHVLAEATGTTANPSTIGRKVATAVIQDAMREALESVQHPIRAVGIGIAGASAAYATDWLVATVSDVLPGTRVIASSDNEIALVGAHGSRRGAIVLAGTGSVAFAIDPQGQPVQTGGWGYLLGDEGGGYWLAAEALRASARWHDGIQPKAEALTARVMTAFGFARPADILAWLYRYPPPVRETASYAPMVLEAAAHGDAAAAAIVERGAAALALLAQTVCARAGIALDVRFCGGLLTAENPLSAALCRRLGLEAIPQPMYPPAMGAALLAKLSLEG